MAIKIMLDAGHYGKYNRSPVLKSYYESEAMWELHLLLKVALEQYGFTVLTTREDQNTDLPVYERGKASRGCDLFLSLHSNAASGNTVDRVEVYHAFDNKNGSDVLAGSLAKKIAEVMSVSCGKVKTRESESYPGTEYYGVLRGACAVGTPLYYIIEHSFHTNPYAAKWLSDSGNLQFLATAEAAVIAAYYGAQKATGDVNGDGKVNATDYILLKRSILGTAKLTEEQARTADITGDGKVNATDYIALKRKLLN